MDVLIFISMLSVAGLSTAVIAQAFEIKKSRKKIEHYNEIETDEGTIVCVEFTDCDTQVVKGVRTVSSEDMGITLRAPNGDVVATIKPELVRAVYAEHAVTAEEASE
ncbi:hypothetical protein [Virgibacillus proomii]|uniref:hypothetical protein n=1 Tax=Virgibacillus proomii TaxID=84407 RepID=UPI001C10252A|nr:hypothetical protein [Virgibacillus proomii]MBU5266256.1 hypothetical protein [Virgibacillus proomii]